MRVTTAVRIRRDIDAVFAYVADPLHLPAWNSAVSDVRSTTAGHYVMTRRLPTGTAANDLVITAVDAPRRFAIKTTSGPTPFHYEYRLTSDGEATTVELDAQADLGGMGVLGVIASRGLRSGIEHNLNALKRILEPAPR